MEPISRIIRSSAQAQAASNSQSLRERLLENHHSAGPIDLIKGSFLSGANFVCLSDPHPFVNRSEEYALFLKTLIKELIQNAGIKKIFLELMGHKLNTKIDPLSEDWKTWEGAGNSFYSYLETHDQLDLEQFESLTPKGPGGIENAGRLVGMQKHWIPMISAARELGTPLYLYDPRGSNKTTFHLSITVSDEIERVSHENIISNLDLNDPNEKALLIGGAAHLSRNSDLNRLGKRLADTSGIRLSTINVVVGWQDDLSNNDYQLMRELQSTGINFLALNSTDIEGLRDLIFLRTEKEVTIFQHGSFSNAPFKISTSDFDKLIYFDKPSDIP